MKSLIRPAFIDPDVEYMTVTRFRELSGPEVRELDHSIVITHPGKGRTSKKEVRVDQAVAVLVPYRQYLVLQELLMGQMQPILRAMEEAL